MPQYANTTKTDEGTIEPGGVRSIAFRPDHAGPVTVWAAPQPHPQAPAPSEPQLLGKVTVIRPGTRRPVASRVVPISDQALTLDFEATQAELDASPGDWACELLNQAEVSVLYDTSITYVGSRVLPTVETASFDLELLDIIVRQAVNVAGARFHLMTSPPLYAAAISSIAGDGQTVHVTLASPNGWESGASVEIDGTENFNGTWTNVHVDGLSTFSFDSTIVASESSGTARNYTEYDDVNHAIDSIVGDGATVHATVTTPFSVWATGDDVQISGTVNFNRGWSNVLVTGPRSFSFAAPITASESTGLAQNYSHPDPAYRASCITWSDTVADTIFKGKKASLVHVDDFGDTIVSNPPVPLPYLPYTLVFRPIDHISTDPIEIEVDQVDPLIHARANFGKGTLGCINLDGLEIKLEQLTIDLDIWFAGNVDVKNVFAQAEVTYKGYPAPSFIADPSADVQSQVESHIQEFIGSYPIAKTFETFFIRLLRLDEEPVPGGPHGVLGGVTPPVPAQASILAYRVENGALLVDYYVLPALTNAPLSSAPPVTPAHPPLATPTANPPA